MIKFDTSEIDKFVIDLKGTSEDIRADVQKVLKKSGFNIEANAKLNITNNGSVKTGHLRRGITTDVGNMEVTVHTSNIKYARGVEEGTRPHTIRAKNKKALYWKGAKHPVKSVRHPGSRAKPFLIPAFEKEKEVLIRDLEKVIKW
ncbi:MAG: HK97 gp10 family phage protein [Peptostreptococcaceae bacterium]|nr:HK97 gp10 family phage protein [Peptostreptococcaceae bacterium]